MDTKLKKSKPFAAWMCFFLGLNLFLSLAFFGIFYSNDILNNFQDIKNVITGDFKESETFRRDMSERLDVLIRYVTHQSNEYHVQKGLDMWVQNFSDEGWNLLYWANDGETGKWVTNFPQSPTFDEAGQFILPEGYDYYLFFDQGMLHAKKDSRTLDIYRFDSGYLNLIPNEYLMKQQDDPRFNQTRVLLAVKADIQENPYAQSALYENYREYRIIRWFIIGVGLLCFLSMGLLIASFILRKAKREFDGKIAGAMGWLLLEVKLLLSVFALSVVGRLLLNPYPVFIARFSIESLVLAAIGCWWFYFILIDLIYNKRRFLTHNTLTWMIRLYRSFESGRPFRKALMMRAYALVLAELALVGAAFLTVLWGSRRGRELIALMVILLLMAVGVYLIYRYLKRYARTLGEFSQMIDQTERMTNGDFSSSISLSGDSDFYEVAQNLNLIQQGVQKATEEKLKSERLKIELITNVSHDLKTPLTSIISYVDLLSGEEGLPEHVKDYIAILSQKSDRLKSLIEDIFDLSKVSSGAIDVQMEKLDLPKLIQQTLADMQDEITTTGLTFRTQYPEEPVLIMGDGKKLYHVFQNLLTNIFKYALEDSRVYVDVWVEGNKAFVSLKNIANYEMNFKEEDILERFVRGEKSRSTEGSGLGLAIARGYVQTMGGDFDIKVDGDLFKVTLRFSVISSSFLASIQE